MTDAPPTSWRSEYARNPRLLVLTLAMVLVTGFSSYQLLPRREDPELSGRFATVVTSFPGASAERVEALVSEKLEEALQEIEEIKLLESESRAGISNLIIELRDDVYETGPVWTRLRDEISDAEVELPEGAGTPAVNELEVDAKALIAAVVWNGEGPAPRNLLTRLAEDFEDRLRGLAGTKETELRGVDTEEVLVEVDPARLAALGLSIESLAQLLDGGDSKVSAGRLHAQGAELGLEVAGEFDSLDRIRDVVLASGDTGQVVYLSDVATVSKTVASPARARAWIDGRPGVAIGAIIESSERIDRWATAARAEVDAFRAELSGDVALEVVFDQSDYTADRLSNLLANLGLGAALVVVALLVLMGWRSAILVGLALPLASLMVLFGMRLLGLPIHQMSVTGLIIALGLLIDNAIVMVDEVRHSLDEGLDSIAAIERSVRRLLVPLFGSTFTTVLAFMPIVLMPGPAGEFVGAIGLTVSLALFSSLFLSMTVLPTLAARLSRPIAEGDRAPWWRRGLHTPGLASIYDRALGLFLRRPLLGLATSLVLPCSGFAVFGELEEQFFPPADRDQFQAQLWLPQQATLEETSAAVAELRRIALTHPEVTAVHGYVGESAPKFYYNIPEGTEGAPHYAQVQIELSDRDAAQAVALELQEELDSALPQAQVVVRMLEQGPPFDAPVEVRVLGPDLDVLSEIGRDLRAILSGVGGVVHTRSTLDADRPKLWFDADPVGLARTGYDRVGLASALEGLLEGRVGGSLVEAGEELPVRVRAVASDRGDLDRIGSLPIEVTGSSSVGWTTTAALGELRLDPEMGAIRRRNGTRETTVQGFLEAGILPSAGLTAFQRRLEELDYRVPSGYTLEFGGESAERDDAIGNLLASVGVLLVMMVATLVLSFQSFRMAAIVGGVGIQSMGLALLALWAFGFPFGFMAIIGTMGLIGVAINDSIVVLAGIRDDPRARTGDADAIRNVVRRATRHVLSTTITTMAGFTPLIVAGGQFWPPLAVALGFGVTGSTLLALVFVPTLYRLLSRFGRADRSATLPAATT